MYIYIYIYMLTKQNETVMQNLTLTFFKAFFTFDKKFQMQDESGTFFHKIWQLIWQYSTKVLT